MTSDARDLITGSDVSRVATSPENQTHVHIIPHEINLKVLLGIKRIWI